MDSWLRKGREDGLLLTSHHALSVDCPVCGSLKGFPCRIVMFSRNPHEKPDPHQGRVDAYSRWKDTLK